MFVFMNEHFANDITTGTATLGVFPLTILSHRVQILTFVPEFGGKMIRVKTISSKNGRKSLKN